jgi:hypothetical protein
VKKKMRGPWRKWLIACILVFHCSLSLGLGIGADVPVKDLAVWLFL